MSNWSPEPHELFADNNPGYMKAGRSNPELEEELCLRLQVQSMMPGIISTIMESDWFADQFAICLEELANDYVEISAEELRHIAADVRNRVL